MRAVFQRVFSASVEANGRPAGAIGKGFVLFLGIERGDGPEQIELLCGKAAGLRVFEDENGKMNRSALEIGGGALVIPNFTLCGDCRHGRRPDFTGAARPDDARPLFLRAAETLRALGLAPVEQGVFGADMRVLVENDGPVTVLLDTRDWIRAGGNHLESDRRENGGTAGKG